MTRPVNRQSRSVGNLGDILKHAALTELAYVLAERGPVSFVETHTFLLHSPIADLERWGREVDALVAKHRAYARYAALERASLARSEHYRCSSGLVLDVLGDRRDTASLAEADATTRAQLREQLGAEAHPNVILSADATLALCDARPEIAALLIHVDPFALSPDLWASLAPKLDALCERSSRVAVVVYRYTRSAPSPWPTAPRSTLGPVAHIRGGPHELAVYASLEVEDAVREVCASLGWHTAR